MIPLACFCPWCGAINQVTFPCCYRCDLPIFESATASSRTAVRPYRSCRLLKGRYFIQRCISIGASVVYEACDRLLHRDVIVAEVRFTSNPQTQQLDGSNRFLQEVAILIQMEPPQVLQIDDLFTEHEECYLVMEWKSLTCKRDNSVPILLPL